MFTRRTATVTMSAPEASCACRMTAWDGYLPVPTMSRERKVRPAMTNGVSMMLALAAADGVDDLHAIALPDHRRLERAAPDDLEVVLDGHAPGVDVEPGEQVQHRHRPLQLVPLAVEGDEHVRDASVRSAYRAESGQVNAVDEVKRHKVRSIDWASSDGTDRLDERSEPGDAARHRGVHLRGPLRPRPAPPPPRRVLPADG